MSNVTAIQNTLLAEIFSSQPSGLFDTKGLEIYRSNLRATATQALTVTFPTVSQLIGLELLSHATNKLLTISPPYHGDWARWGQHLPAVLKDLDALQDFPFVAECARLDYICHQLVREKDAYVNLDSLLLLQQQDPEHLFFQLNPTVHLITSKYPIDEIRSAHRLPNQQLQKQAFQQAINNARNTEQFHVICYRNGQDIQISKISTTDHLWLNTLKTHNLNDALNAIKNTDFSFENWLHTAIADNLLGQVALST